MSFSISLENCDDCCCSCSLVSLTAVCIEQESPQILCSDTCIASLSFNADRDGRTEVTVGELPVDRPLRWKCGTRVDFVAERFIECDGSTYAIKTIEVTVTCGGVYTEVTEVDGGVAEITLPVVSCATPTNPCEIAIELTYRKAVCEGFIVCSSCVQGNNGYPDGIFTLEWTKRPEFTEIGGGCSSYVCGDAYCPNCEDGCEDCKICRPDLFFGPPEAYKGLPNYYPLAWGGVNGDNCQFHANVSGSSVEDITPGLTSVEINAGANFWLMYNISPSWIFGTEPLPLLVTVDVWVQYATGCFGELQDTRVGNGRLCINTQNYSGNTNHHLITFTLESFSVTEYCMKVARAIMGLEFVGDNNHEFKIVG